MTGIRKWLALIILTTGAWGAARALDDAVLEDMKWQPDVVESPSNAVSLWFPVGEKLTYDIFWGVFQVATTEVTTDWVRWFDGRLLLRIRYRTESNKMIDSIYPVKDLIDSYIDPVTFLPVRFIKNTREGKRRELAVTDFNHAEGTARWRKQVRHFKDWILPIKDDLRDIPSLSYWLRKGGFHAGIPHEYKVMADDLVYDLSLKVRDRNETVPVPDYGLVPVLEVQPEAAFEGLFVRKGKITAWVSKGAPCLLLRMDAEVPVAKIRIRLAKIQGPKRDAWSDLWLGIKK
jgi:hypothetical protein